MKTRGLPGGRAPFRDLPLDLRDADATRAGIQDPPR